MDALGIIAIVLAVIGIAGWFLPVVPGVFMKVTGGHLIGTTSIVQKIVKSKISDNVSE